MNVPIEFWCLIGASLLGFIHLSLASFSFKAQVGNRYTVGARDEGRTPEGIAGRLERAHKNFQETFPYFASAVLLSLILGTSNWLSEAGAVLYLTGRILFLPLYWTGVPWLRTLSWNMATLGVVMVLARVLIGTMSAQT